MDEVSFLKIYIILRTYSCYCCKIQADVAELQHLLTLTTRRNVRNCLANEINKMEAVLKQKQAELAASEKARVSSISTNLPLNKILNYGK